jgi:hypothetical protein
MAMKRVGGMMRTRTCINDAGTRPMHNWLRRSYGHGNMLNGGHGHWVSLCYYSGSFICRPDSLQAM